MSVPPAVHGLQPAELEQLRALVTHELVHAARHDAPRATLQRFSRTLDTIDARIDRRADDPDGVAERRRRNAASKSPSSRVAGRGRG